MLFRGLSYPYAGRLGVTMFHPDITGINSDFLYAMTGGNSEVRINGFYPELTFSKDPAVKEYIDYVGKIAEQRLASRDYGVTGGKITADIDDDTNMIYAKPDGDVSRLTKVIANITMVSGEDEYYLGSMLAEYNDNNERYEIANQDEWGSINGVPFTYTDNGNHSITVPVVAFWDGKDDPYPEANEDTDQEIVVKDPDEEIGKLTIQLNSDGRTVLSEYIASVTTRNYNFLSTTRALHFHPVRIKVNEDGSYGDYVVNPLVRAIQEEQYIDPDHDEDAEPFAVMTYFEGFQKVRPSDSIGFMLGYRFMAYDMNEKSYVSNSIVTLNFDPDKVDLEKVPAQLYTGAALKPAPTFSFAGIDGIDLETLQFLFADVTFEASYKNNTKAGTGTLTVKAVRKSDGKVAKTYSEKFKIVKSAKVGGSVYKANSKKGGTVSFVKAKNAKTVTVPAEVTIGGRTFKVTQIQANALKSSKAKKLTVMSKKLTKVRVKGSLKGSKVKTITVNVGSKALNKQYVKKYKKFFTKKNAGRKVKLAAA